MSTVFVESAKHDPRGVGVNRPVNTVPLSSSVDQLNDGDYNARKVRISAPSSSRAHSAPHADRPDGRWTFARSTTPRCSVDLRAEMAAIITRQYAQRKCWTVDDGRIFVDDGISPNDYEKRSAMSFRQQCARRRSGKSSDPAGGSGATLEQQCRCDGSSRPVSVKATRRDHVTEGNLCIVDAGGRLLRISSWFLASRTGRRASISWLTNSTAGFEGCGDHRSATVDRHMKAVFGGCSLVVVPSSAPRSGWTKIFDAGRWMLWRSFRYPSMIPWFRLGRWR